MIDDVQCDNKRIKTLIENITSKRKQSYSFFLKIIPSIINMSGSTAKNIIKKSMAICIKELNNNIHGNENILSYRIFGEISKLFYRGLYIEEIQTSFDELYCDMTDQNSLLKYFMFYYEFDSHIHITNHENKSRLELKNREELLELKNKYPRVYIDDLIVGKKYTPQILVNAIIYISSKFEKDDITKEMPFFYIENMGRVDLLTIYLFEQFKIDNLDSVVDNISLILSNGVSNDFYDKTL